MAFHFLSAEVAKECGVNASLLITNIYFWCEHNKTNNINYHEGRYWTYNSMKAFSQQFPYLTRRQIEVALKKLEDAGLIITGNFNKVAFDRTKWYTVSEKGIALLATNDVTSLEVSNPQPGGLELTPSDNESSHQMEMRVHTDVTPIPDNIPDNIPSKKEKERKKGKKQNSYDQIINSEVTNESVKAELYEYIKMRKMIKKPMTDRALQLLINKLRDLSKNADEAVQILDQSITGNWMSVYPLKEDRNHQGWQGNGRKGVTEEDVSDFEGL